MLTRNIFAKLKASLPKKLFNISPSNSAIVLNSIVNPKINLSPVFITRKSYSSQSNSNFLFAAEEKNIQAPSVKIDEKLATVSRERLISLNLLPDDLGSAACEQRLNSVRVFYAADQFANNLVGDKAFSLERSLTKVAAVDVQASLSGQMLDGSVWPGAEFFMDLLPGDERGLSTAERVKARNKIIASQSLAYRYGGYPANNSIVVFPEPKKCFIFSMAGLQFENANLDYQLCIIDAFNNPEKYKLIQESMTNGDDLMQFDYIPLKTGLFRYIQRKENSGDFSTGFYLSSAVFLDRDAYFNLLVKDFTLLFSAAEKMVGSDKQIYFKLPFAGMGFFAKIDGCYDIKNYLIPIYISALQEVLKNKKSSQLGIIEAPIFSAEMKEVIDLFVPSGEVEINGVKLIFNFGEDALNFNGIDEDKYHLCVLNPADANSLPGNEFGFGKDQPSSVESAIGNNTDIRFVQNYLLNPNVLKLTNWVGINLTGNKYEEEKVDVEDYQSTMRIR